MSKIISLEFIEVVVPTHPGSINSKGLAKPLHMIPSKGSDAWSKQFDEFPKLLLKLTLKNGIVGLGEFYRDHSREVVDNIGASLLGIDINALSLQKLPIGYFREYDGFECAIWDAYAKLHSLRMVDLLGGPMQERIKVTAWSGHRHLNEVGKVAKKFALAGYDCIKFKCDLDDDVVGWAKEIKKHVPKMSIIYDPNQRWENLGETKYRMKALEQVGNILCLEDPLPHWMLQDYATLRGFTSIRVVRHVSLPYVSNGQRIHDLINIISHKSADGYNFNGGLEQFRRLANIAETANQYFWHGSEVDLGILEAMYLHQSAAAKHCIWPSDIFGRLIRTHDLLRQPLAIKPPYATLPQSKSLPHSFGLGVELDEKALKKYTINQWKIK